uniref:tRNA (guanosine(18)-2'-O)-methyltransferase TARBP1 n=1 Tax=Heliothis virescens TaxID=7102 RepID=A0A2A4K8N7_HELVI
MDTQEELLSFLDLLDIHEEVIDTSLKSLMTRSKHSTKQLKTAILLLKYKLLINIQEGTECENDEELDFVVKLLKDLTSDNVEYVCKCINIVLCLNPSSAVSKSEHLLQQILSNIEFQSESASLIDKDSTMNTLLMLKAADSILNAAIKLGEKLSLLFFETPLERILDTSDETLKMYFITNTVPKIVDAVIGYNILDKIWVYIQSMKADKKENALKVLSCLSDNYLPTPDIGDTKFVSDIIFQQNFWDLILFGIISDNTAIRKISVYLTKKAIDCIMATKKDINVKSNNLIIFQWNPNNSYVLKNMWDNFFVLIDSLEEKQSNIVLPSLRLFEAINIGDCWINAAFNIGLKHENTQVRLKCIEYKLKTKIGNQLEAETLLEAINDINIYDQSSTFEVLKTEMAKLLEDKHCFVEIFQTISLIKSSPVPLYHVTDVLANLKMDLSLNNEVAKTVIEILKIPCNNVVLRKAVHLNMAHFINNCHTNLNWKDLATIYSSMALESDVQNNLFTSVMKQVSFDDKRDTLKAMSEDYNNIDLIILYLHNHEEDINIVIDIITEKLNKIQGGVNRQYSDKKEYLIDVMFLLDLLNKTRDNDTFLHTIHVLIANQNKTLLQYLLCLFSSGDLSIEDAVNLYEKYDYEFEGKDLKDTLLNLYKTSVLFLKEGADLDKAVLSIFTLKMTLKNPIMKSFYEQEMLNVKTFLDIFSTVKFKDVQNESVGRSKNVFYEKSTELIYYFIQKENHVDSCLADIIHFIDNVLECGGYGCLKWILKIVNKIIHPLINNESNFNTTQFINRVWNEIEELKSNNQYSPCIEQFVQLITQDVLLKKSMYNNIVISYCNKIIEYGPVKTNPLFYLIRELNKKDFKEYGHLVYVLCEIMLYCPVPRKDQRIADNLTLDVLQNPKYGINRDSIDIHFNYEIQYLSISTLCSIEDSETLRMITNFITIRIDNTFKNKQRYHGNSHLHRILQTSLQHILILVIKNGDLKNGMIWCMDMLVKLPHQPSVRICLEWFISLGFYIQHMELNVGMLQILKSKNIPLTSQFFILYWLLKHKICNKCYAEHEYDFVIDFLLSHTMGQLFNVRLNAQYLATNLYKLANKVSRFHYTIGVIEKTFAESNSDKNFLKLKSDYFTNHFDTVANLTPYFVYYVLPKYCDIDNNEKVDLNFIKSIMKDINESISRNSTDAFVNEWKCCRREDEQFTDLEIKRGVDIKSADDSEYLGTIQKKYIPWRNMSEVNVYDAGKKNENPSNLIVVASLIDKLPNLGGMARTSEVFGVQTYVVDSLRHLQDKQFQGLSVSAERWINVEEVRPGRPLKEYLMKKKEEGYAVVAAEQTSTSSKLQAFKFPKKTLLLLGHEKEGIPCDLLPLMNHCVEIPQQGYVRSLNVHVTAAIFVWEYARQNVL